ncbi:unnamed protein product [Strongylus vulgaris]|uniref:Uncharacterized protein n=1 Tax=Strongylus vulgaris TaxID=40348 RepID=A0A3P7JHT8_STRVU|nr:unnamed protein product [Strongylus vulgaris]
MVCLLSLVPFKNFTSFAITGKTYLSDVIVGCAMMILSFACLWAYSVILRVSFISANFNTILPSPRSLSCCLDNLERWRNAQDGFIQIDVLVGNLRCNSVFSSFYYRNIHSLPLDLQPWSCEGNV